LLRQFDEATQGAAPGSVVLTTAYRLAIYRPVSRFNVWDAHHAHPAGLFSEPQRFIERLSDERDRRCSPQR
jgi:hypothetical protein